MLARSSILHHPLAGQVNLPLLIPSFSSKGFPFGRSKALKHEYSEVAYVLADFASRPSVSALISAYDVHFRHFEAPGLPNGSLESRLRNSRLLFVDSGGYELAHDFDSTEPKAPPYTPKEGFDSEEHLRVLRVLAAKRSRLHLVISNFDHSANIRPLREQIADARALFQDYPSCVSSFIMKPWERKQRFVDPTKMSDRDFADLGGFQIIGITEKDLGSDLWDRLRAIARLRVGLDKAKIAAPIQIWGGLEPVLTPLYFFAGGEIFDGVSWMRYAYRNGLAVSRECYPVIHPDLGVAKGRQLSNAHAFMSNLSFLDNLTSSLQTWLIYDGKRFDMFHEDVQDHLKRAFQVMRARIEELKEVR